MASSSLVASPVPVEDLLGSASCRRTLGHFSLDEIFQVFVATVGKDSSRVPLYVRKSDTIACVKLKIQADQGYCVDQQRLVHAGKELTRDECFLQDYGIQNGDVLHLVLLIPSIVSLSWRTVDGKSVVYKVRQAEDAKDLHKFISDTGDDLSSGLRVVELKVEELEDSKIAEELSLRGESVLYIRLHRPNGRPRIVRSEEVEPVVPSAEDAPSPGNDFQISPSGTVQSFGALDLKDASPWSFRGERERYPGYGLQHPAPLLPPSKYPISFDLPNVVKELLERVNMGLLSGQVPRLTPEGSGGVYSMMDEHGLQNVAVFKPMDEEPMSANNPRGLSRSTSGEGLRRGTKSGEGAIREVAAFLLDHPAGNMKRMKANLSMREGGGFAGVPPTTLATCYNEAFHHGSDVHKVHKAKTGSLQQFVHSISSCEDMGSSMFPVDEVHKISVLDLRLANTDRNGGNILVCQGEDESIRLVPIDHGYCLPDKFEDCCFEWLYWPQAQKPYSQRTVEYIKSLDADEDISLLRQCGWVMRPQVARIFRIATMVLKKGAVAGLSPFEIGSIMSRNGQFDVKSPIELIMEKVQAMNLRGHAFLSELEKLLDKHIASIK